MGDEPTTGKTDGEILRLCSKVDAALSQLGRFAETEKTLMSDHDEMIRLKDRFDNISRTLDELRNLVKDDPGGRPIVYRLHELERQIKEVCDEISKFKTIEKAVRDMEEEGRKFAKSCEVCRRELDVKLKTMDDVEEEKKKEAKIRDSERRQIKWAIILLIVAQVVQWFFSSHVPKISIDQRNAAGGTVTNAQPK